MPVSILHFSDIHNNKVALRKVLSLSSQHKDHYVAITGDVCSLKSPFPAHEYDALRNPKIWMVRGNHDQVETELFSRLKKVIWQPPYFSTLSEKIAVLGLDSETDQFEPQLKQVEISVQRSRLKTIIVLHHRPYSVETKKMVTSWIKKQFPGALTLLLLHGHEHGDREFFSKILREEFSGFVIYTSHVYSANLSYKLGEMAGCANRFTFDENALITRIEKVTCDTARQVRPLTWHSDSPQTRMGMCRLCLRPMRYEDFEGHFQDHSHHRQLTESEKQNKDVIWVDSNHPKTQNISTPNKSDAGQSAKQPKPELKDMPVSEKSLKMLVENALKSCQRDPSGWISLSALNNALCKLDHSFSSQKYGYKKLTLLVNSLATVLETKIENEQHLVRLRH